ncbi:MAG: hypothetical protein ABH807_03245 [Candidatus Shapirobacteria bacterium]
MKLVVFVVLIARLLLTLLPSHKVDMGGYNYWSHYLADRGFSGIYETHLVYGPAYLYLLFISGKVASFFAVSDLTHEFLIKLWAVLFDFIGGFLIYLVGKQHKKRKLGFWLSIFYILNPAIFINSSIWGQFDSLLATLLFAVVYFFTLKRQVTAVILYTVAVLTKPQSIFLLPLVTYLFFFQEIRWKKILLGAIGVISTYLLFVLPVFRSKQILDLFLWLPRLYFKYVNDYPYATANGFNFWMLTGGQTVHDSEAFWGLTFAAWEKILVLALWAFVLWALIKIKKTSFSLYYLAYLLGLGFFMFYGRMHERYLVPAVIFLMVCVIQKPFLGILAAILSVCVWINQHYMYELAKRDIYWLAKDDTLALTIALILMITLGYSFYYYVHKQVRKIK